MLSYLSVINLKQVTYMLKNPFYYGHFRYAGEVHEGKHQPVISKQLFDQVQVILDRKGKPQPSH